METDGPVIAVVPAATLRMGARVGRAYRGKYILVVVPVLREALPVPGVVAPPLRLVVILFMPPAAEVLVDTQQKHIALDN